MDLRALLGHVIEVGGSDLHLKVGSQPMIRVDGDLLAVSGVPKVTDGDTEDVLDLVTERTPRKREYFYDTGELDTAYHVDGIGRFRVNGFRQRGLISFALRYVPKEVPSFDALGLPAGVEKLAGEERGLIVVTGATGAGKTTTLASMIDHMNRTRRRHIVTLEDPIEIVHEDKSSLVSQREIGLDTESFDEALRRVLRQDPDIILIGELRDEESARAALQAGESGHLVLSTMHTLDAKETIARLVELFPHTKQQLVRHVLAGTLRGVLSQRLLPRIGGGRVAAVEVMINTARIADLILDPIKTDEIPRVLEQGTFHLMQSFQQHLVQLVLEGLVDADVAATASGNRHDFELALAHAERKRQVEEAESAAADPDAPLAGHTLAPAITAALKLAGSR